MSNEIDPVIKPDVARLPQDPLFQRSMTHPYPEPPARLFRLLGVTIVVVVAFDTCFWAIADTPGLSFGLFFAVLAGCILLCRETASKGRSSLLILALLLGAACEAVIETCLTNTIVLLILTIVLAGHTYFRDIESWWGRWLSQVVALLFAPGRIFWLAGRGMEVGVGGGARSVGTLFKGCLLAIPALVLLVVFGSLLASGNAVFSGWTGSAFDWVIKEIESYLNPLRMLLWLFVACAVLPFLRPARISDLWWKWLENLPQVPEFAAAKDSFVSSALVLAAMNVIFLISNFADALFLWGGRPMPATVSYYSYVHEGVNSLIATVILSAVVLAGIFQQVPAVAKRRELKILSYVWIIQNLVLIVSVAEKLRRFIVSYEMTVARLSTIIFLLLVASGFVLLTIRIMRDKSLSWLIGGCTIAIFTTFYLTQFFDLAGWSASYNVAVMEKNPAHVFDANTMCQWRSDVWPALRRAHNLAPDNKDITDAFEKERTGQERILRTGGEGGDWREFGLRAYWNRTALENK